MRINESPNDIIDYSLLYTDNDSIGFFYNDKIKKEDIPIITFTLFGDKHRPKVIGLVNGEIKEINTNNNIFNIHFNDKTIDGRLWLTYNLLSMWDLPNIEFLDTIINELKETFKEMLSTIKHDTKYSYFENQFVTSFKQNLKFIEKFLSTPNDNILIDSYSVVGTGDEGIYSYAEIKKMYSKINDRERTEHTLSPLQKTGNKKPMTIKNTFRREANKLGISLFGDSANTIFNYINESVNGWGNYLEKVPMLKYGVELLDVIEDIGRRNGVNNPVAYIVGGAVRDIVIGNEYPHDIDIATNVNIKYIENEMESFDIGKNKDFGIFVTKYKGYTYEIANFRSDGEYSDGRRPDSVENVDSFEKDAQRRDLTINAMAIDKDGNVIDYVNGIEDINKGKIKTVGDPNKRFDEDKLRMMRAIRFASKFDFDIDQDTIDAIKRNAPSISNVSTERIVDELKKVASYGGEAFASALKLLDEYGILEYILPDVAKFKELKHNVRFHPEGALVKNKRTGEIKEYDPDEQYGDEYEIIEGTVWDHVLAAIAASPVKDDLINLAILFHDIGKTNSYKYIEGKGHTYYGHENTGIELINKLAKELHLSNKTRDAILFATKNHMKLHNFKSLSDKKKFELISDPNWEVLKNTSKADSMARGKLYDEGEWDELQKIQNELREKFKDFSNEADIKKKYLSGGHIMQLLGMSKGGEIIGNIQKDVLPEIINNNITDQQTIDELIKKSYEKFR